MSVDRDCYVCGVTLLEDKDLYEEGWERDEIGLLCPNCDGIDEKEDTMEEKKRIKLGDTMVTVGIEEETYIDEHGIERYKDGPTLMEQIASDKFIGWCAFMDRECTPDCMAFRAPGHPDFERTNQTCLRLAAAIGQYELGRGDEFENIASSVEHLACETEQIAHNIDNLQM